MSHPSDVEVSPLLRLLRERDHLRELISTHFGPRYRVYCEYCHSDERICRNAKPGYCALSDYERTL